MTCSVLPIRDCQPHSQLARRWPRSVRPAGLTVTLCPATCSLTEMVTGHPRSVGDGRTYPLGKPVTTFAGATVGTSTLTRTGSGISFSLQTIGLQAGHAVTVWWMVFNPDGPLSVQYAAGHVIDDSGVAEFGGHLSVGDTDGVINNGPGLLDALGADVVLVVRDHGPADPGRLPQGRP
jgi:hypothetical protein